MCNHKGEELAWGNLGKEKDRTRAQNPGKGFDRGRQQHSAGKPRKHFEQFEKHPACFQNQEKYGGLAKTSVRLLREPAHPLLPQGYFFSLQ